MERLENPEEFIKDIYERKLKSIITSYKDEQHSCQADIKKVKLISLETPFLCDASTLIFIACSAALFGLAILCIKFHLEFLAYIILFIVAILMSACTIYTHFMAMIKKFEKPCMRFAKLEANIKKIVMPILCKSLKDISWDYQCYNKPSSIENSLIMPTAFKMKTKLNYDDVFYGKYKNINYEIIEVKPITLTRSVNNEYGEYSSTTTILKFNTRKKYTGHTIIYPSVFEKPLTLKETQMEDVIFEKKYNVFTNNEVEARYIITPKLIDALNKAKEKLKCAEIACSFYNKHLFIGLNYISSPGSNKDCFKVGLFDIGVYGNNMDSYTHYLNIYNELIAIQEVIDYFNFL